MPKNSTPTTASTQPSSGTVTERPPVVVIMGHIDHGKSTLLDYIRKTNIVAGEAGGITQHLGAYEVTHTSKEGKKGRITFLDTPGHEAFCDIRTRGSKVADIAILVVSAEDGVKPQTLEALNCIKEESLPYIVAINKIDKPGANIERTKQNLAENEVYVEGWGGDISAVPISALNGTGISDLLDMVMLVAEFENLTGDTARPASGIIIEANMDTKKGISSTLIVMDGTLTSGTYVVAGDAFAPVRILEDFLGKPLKQASFSSPVKVIGWNTVPTVGSDFTVVTDKKVAEAMILEASKKKAASAAARAAENKAYEGKIVIPLIIKADVTGSLDGIKHELAKISHDKVALRIVAQGIGAVSETDLKLAQGLPDTIILHFNTKVDSKAQAILERTPIKIHSFNIIYNLVEFVKNTLTAKIPKIKVEESTGRAKILEVFSKAKDRQIVGGKVQEGTITLGSEVKIIRRDAEIGRGRIKELQQQKQRVEEVREGYEFGSMIESKIEIAQGDKIEGFTVTEK